MFSNKSETSNVTLSEGGVGVCVLKETETSADHTHVGPRLFAHTPRHGRLTARP